MKLFEMRLWVRLSCGRCGRTANRTIFYVEQDTSRYVVLGCQQCHDYILVIRLFPVPEFTFVTTESRTKIDLDKFSLRERTI